LATPPGSRIRLRPGLTDTPDSADRLYDPEIRRVLCSTNAIESLNARYRRAVRARGHFPTEQAALKCLYLVARSLDPTGKGQTRWTMRWKPALNAFSNTFGDRWPSAQKY
jgi:transposase-like protein